MLTSIFAEKLRRVSSNLQVDFAGLNYNVNQHQGTCPIYELGKWVEIPDYDRSLLDYEGQKLAEREKVYLAYVPAKWVPEYSQYNSQLVIITPGYRDILNKICKMRPQYADCIKKYFGYPNGFNYDWDHQSSTQRAWRQGVEIQSTKSVEQLQNTKYLIENGQIHEI